MAQIVLYSDTSAYNFNYLSLPNKAAGVYRLATELRQYGYTVQVINHLFSLTYKENMELCDRHIDQHTIAVGFSTTFWYPNEEMKDYGMGLIADIIHHMNLKAPQAKLIVGGTNMAEIEFINSTLDNASPYSAE